MVINFGFIWLILLNLLTSILARYENEAKFWLNPLKIARESRFRQVDLREIERIIKDNLEFLLNAWEEEKGKHVNG
jgi:3-methyladenine DNA glycosylase AlkD